MPSVLDLPLMRGKPGSLNLRPACFAEKRLAVGVRNAEPRYPVGVLASTGEWPASVHDPLTGAGLLRDSHRLSRARKNHVGAVLIDVLIGLLRQKWSEQAAVAARHGIPANGTVDLSKLHQDLEPRRQVE